jgi:GT2 family glycosyltransferase
VEYFEKMKIDIVVPVYRNLDLVRGCLSSLEAHLTEIAEFDPRLVVIDDSPDDTLVSAYLTDAKRKGIIDVLIVNEVNQGFVKSVNKGFSLARDRGAAVLLVNSDTVTFENTLREIVSVSKIDPQFGFVCPRSNNASLCTFPTADHNRAGKTFDPEACFSAWKDVHDYLPRFSLVPTAIGFYMLISATVVANFGYLDEKFGVGYEEENDLVMRAGKVGFRAVLANHAFAYHAGSASFALTSHDLKDQRETNLRKIIELHPEFLPLVHKYESSPEFRAERKLSALVPDASGKVDLVFNLATLAPTFNGTNEFVASVIRAIDKINSHKFNFYIACRGDSAKFHALDKLENIRLARPSRTNYAVAFSFGQPYDLHAVNVMEELAPINVYSMLDTISLDCSNLRFEQAIKDLWKHVAATSNGLLFISDFSREIFLRRFDVRETKLFARLLPTRLSEYERRYLGIPRAHSHVFVAGNHFEHKDSSRTAKYLATEFPSLRIAVMGRPGEYPRNVEFLQSGTVEDAHMTEILAASSAIVLPSFYEGFGFSLLHALALGKPVVARDIAPTREILRQFGKVDGVFLYTRDSELRDALRKAIDAKASQVHDERGDSWESWSRELLGFLEELLTDRGMVYDLLIRRISAGDVLRGRHQLERSAASAPRANRALSLDAMAKTPEDDFIRQCYWEILGREPDFPGLVHHQELLKSGVSRADILRALLDSPEYKSSGREVHIAGLNEQPSGKKASLLSRLFRNERTSAEPVVTEAE